MVGKIYPITEQDFLEFIMQRIKAMEQNGELAKLNKQFANNVKEHVIRPTPVVGLTSAQENRYYEFDPSITVAEDIKDVKGNIIFHKGQRVNPLEKVHLTKELIFYNADDKDEVSWVLQENKKEKNTAKLILVCGSIVEQANLFHRHVYFDQFGKLTAHFNILHTPATVQQKGLVLEIREVAVKK